MRYFCGAFMKWSCVWPSANHRQYNFESLAILTLWYKEIKFGNFQNTPNFR